MVKDFSKPMACVLYHLAHRLLLVNDGMGRYIMTRIMQKHAYIRIVGKLDP